jgi:DNA-binding CsgD family transcriptional regulator
MPSPFYFKRRIYAKGGITGMGIKNITRTKIADGKKPSNELLVKEYLEGNKKVLKELFNRFYNTTENIIESCYMDDLLNDKDYNKIPKNAMFRAIKTYDRQKGACFFTYYSTVLRNALIDKRRKILSKKALSGKVTTWKDFKKVRKEKGNIFSIRKARYLLDNFLYWGNRCMDDQEIKSIIDSLTKRELQYISLYANVNATNLIAAKALRVTERTIYNLKRSITRKLKVKDFERLFENKEEFF